MAKEVVEIDWRGMPEFDQPQKEAFAKMVIRFRNAEDLDEFAELIEQKITPKTKSLWHPELERGLDANKRYIPNTLLQQQPRYPIYIVSKGRAHSRLTMRALDRLAVQYLVVVEQSELEDYAAVIDRSRLLVLPQRYLDEYDTCDDLGTTRSKGPGSARNFCWDHAIAGGYKRHWVMDDNLDDFHRLHQNTKVPVRSGALFRAAEDYADRYTNAYICGLNYYSFCKSTDKVPPYVLNTRIYSCLLIENDIPYRWRGRYNEDTDLCLRVLKDGYCTIQFNAFLCGKVTTQRLKGGNTKEFYKGEGTKPKSQMLVDLHPDVAELKWKFNRWHHYVDYRPFKTNKLIEIAGLSVSDEPDDYGLVLIDGVTKKRGKDRL